MWATCCVCNWLWMLCLVSCFLTGFLSIMLFYFFLNVILHHYSSSVLLLTHIALSVIYFKSDVELTSKHTNESLFNANTVILEEERMPKRWREETARVMVANSVNTVIIWNAITVNCEQKLERSGSLGQMLSDNDRVVYKKNLLAHLYNSKLYDSCGLWGNEQTFTSSHTGMWGIVLVISGKEIW